MRKIYWIWIILAVIALSYSLWNFLRPVSSEDIKPTFSPTTSANEPDYQLPPDLPIKAGQDKG